MISFKREKLRLLIANLIGLRSVSKAMDDEQPNWHKDIDEWERLMRAAPSVRETRAPLGYAASVAMTLASTGKA